MAVTSFHTYATNIMYNRYSHVIQQRKEEWSDICMRVCDNVLPSQYVSRDIFSAIYMTMYERKFIPGGRILSQAGRKYHQTDNCYCVRAEDSREGWASLAEKITMMFMSGGGVGISYDEIRPYGTVLQRSGGIASGPVPLIEMINGIGAAVRQGGERRGAIYASLKWNHPDIHKFIAMKEDGLSLAHTNISVRYDKSFFDNLNTNENYDKDWDYNFYDNGKYADFMSTLKHACKFGDPGFQFDNDEQILRNACTEIISSDDSDSCCIGSINLAAITSLQELAEVTELAILFLLCNTMYTDTPTAKVKQVKEKNRRLGLGLMGVAEWFIQRTQSYGCVTPSSITTGDHEGILDSNSITNWFSVYKAVSHRAAIQWANTLNIAIPVAVRAIAPTGTISIVGGHTTPGIEPVFHTAYQRTYNTLKTQQHSNGYVKEKVIDPVVMSLIEQGYNVKDIDTAYTLSQSVEGIEKRLKFQTFVQQYVDNAISSTINLPKYVEGIEDKIAPVLMKYLSQLRGVTFYPNGRYENQPVIPLDINEVLRDSESVSEVYESCKGDGCGA